MQYASRSLSPSQAGFYFSVSNGRPSCEENGVLVKESSGGPSSFESGVADLDRRANPKRSLKKTRPRVSEGTFHIASKGNFVVVKTGV